MARIPIPYSATVGSVVPSGPQAVQMPSPAAQFAPHLANAVDVIGHEIASADAMVTRDAVGQLETLTNQTQAAARSTQGSDAFDLSQYEKDWLKGAQEIREKTLKTEAQRAAYDQWANKTYPQLQDDLAAHTAHQRSIYDESSTEATSAALADKIANNYTNPKIVEETVGDINRVWASYVYGSGKPNEWGAIKADDAISRAHVAAIDRMADTDPAGVRSYYERFGDQIDPGSRRDVEKVVKAAGVKDWSLEKYRAISAQFPNDFAKQRDAASKAAGSDALKYDTLQARIDQEEARRNKEQKDTQDALLNTVLNRVDATGVLDPTDKNYQLLEPGYQLRARAAARQYGTEARLESAEARRQQKEAEDAALAEFTAQDDKDIAASNPRVDLAGASPLTIARAERERRRAIRDIQKQATDAGITWGAVKEDIKNTYAATLGKSKTPAFLTYMRDWYDDFETKNKRPPTPVEYKDAASIASTMGDKYGGGLWSKFSGNRYRFEVPEGETFKPFPEGEQSRPRPAAAPAQPAPPTRQDLVARWTAKYGAPPNDAQLQKLIAATGAK